MSKSLLITNCKLFNALEDEETTAILIEDGIITQIDKTCAEERGIGDEHAYDSVIDAEGKIVAPGFIEVHIQGAGGADVLDGTTEALQTISRTCARFGTTSFLATTVFRPDGDNHHLTVAAENVDTELGGANLLGIHLEGPFISLEKRGMIQPECICEPSQQVFDEIQSITNGCLKMMTIAPELDGNLKMIDSLVDRGIVASLGHTHASYEETLKGIDAGISHVTHLFNAMTPMHHRAPGPRLAILESDRLSVQIISDGVHIHPQVVKFAFDLIGKEHCVTITDGMQAMGLPDGSYVYNGIEYESKDGAARYHDGTLIGTALGLNRMVQRFMEFTGCSFEVAIKTVTENPAKVLGIYDRKGSLDVGKDADLVILDSNFSVYSTIVGGRVMSRSEGAKRVKG